MRLQLRVFDAVDLWRRPAGTVDPWVRWAIAVAAVITVAAAAIGARALWKFVPDAGLDRFWFHNGVALALGLCIAASFAIAGPLARSIRVAVLLPIAHLIATVVGWTLWIGFQSKVPYAGTWSPFTRIIPAVDIAVVAGIGVVVVACIHAAVRRRVGEWLHGVVMGALLTLLLLGLWLPIASGLWCIGSGWDSILGFGSMPAPIGLALLVIIPPVVVALAVTIATMRAPGVLQRRRGLVQGGLGLLALGALAFRLEPTPDARLVYGNFVHVMLAAAVLAILSIVALGAAWLVGQRRSRRMFARRTLSGTIEPDEDPAQAPVAWVEITSWLRGPRIITRPFTVTTAVAVMPVACGIEVIAPIPIVTTRLRTGESAALFAAGDAVRLAGFVEPPAGHPFRASLAPVPGPDGVFVGANPAGPANRLTGLALMIWRPCVVYLLIVATIGLSALVPVL